MYTGHIKRRSEINLTDREKELWKDIDELIRAMQKIRFKCVRAKSHYIEEIDIDEILEIAKKYA